ncbi:CRISPR-associated protein, Csm1 family [Staphylothermus marinus F1]|uniref:CRISPR-associated protein, Csm1 family n=1 Tax=Staphylothermus marinus (strain ATCC 43588 / DSM 3639 / JCM 9404 / F1) TaxID=399550 RepID=A3DLB4_STAMF|nr:HD domain-containing protein [Staphylothermus marinus]ABN69424.1 CRISPR-associated protein, Csm1 family [Staphylothermus marinus F1]
MTSSKTNNKYHELLFAALLHDIGKVLQRGRIGVTEKYSTHDDLGAKFIDENHDIFEHIGIDPETMKLLIKYHHHTLRGLKPPENISVLLEILEKADHDSASERSMGDEIYSKQRSITNYLVSPLWIINYYKQSRKDLSVAEKLPKNSYICYKPVSVIALLRDKSFPYDLELVENVLKAVKCFPENKDEENVFEEIRRYYSEIYKDMIKVLSDLEKATLTGIMGVNELLETLSSYIRYSLIFIPDALYGVDIPSTNLSAHSLLTAALASSYMLSRHSGVSGYEIRVGLLDLSGIQKYIASYARRKGALRQFRGRSLLLQLVMKASAYKLLKELKLNHAHLILERGDSAVFILPSIIDEKTFHNAVKKIEEAIYELFHGDIYIAYGLSEPFRPSYIPPWSKDFGKKGFSKALLELGKKVSKSKRSRFKLLDPRILAKNTIRDESDNRDADMCPLCKATLFKESLIPISKDEAQKLGLEEDVEKICPSCLLAHIAGYAAENLVFIVEIRNKNISDKLFEELRSGKFIVEKVDAINVKYGVIPVKGLDTTYIIISDLSGRKTGHCPLLQSFIETVLNRIIKEYSVGERVEVIIYKNNDPGGFIPHGKDMEKLAGALMRNKNVQVGFSVIFTNVSLQQNELDDLARADNKYTLLSWMKIDGDRIGFTGLHLIGSLGRYATFNELVNLYTNLIGYLILYKNAKLLNNKYQLLRDKVVIVYSGGDDSLIVSRFVEGLYYLKYYHEWLNRFFGRIGDIEALTISASMILRESDYPAYLSYNETINYLEEAKDEGRNRVYVDPLSIDIEGAKSVSWKQYDLLLDNSLDKDLKEWVTKYKQQSYRLLWITRNIMKNHHRYVRESSTKRKSEYYRRVLEYLIAYIYIYNRLSETREFIEKLASKKILTTPLEPKTIIEKYSTDKISEPLILEFDKLSRFLSLLMLRLREKL